MWTRLYDEKRVISASRPPRMRAIQPWMSKTKTLPKHATDGVLEEAWKDTARKDVQAGSSAS